MSKRNENRPGYKKTKVGWIPANWSVAILGDICYQPVSGYSVIGTDRPAKEGEYGVLKLSCIQNGRFEPNENKLVNRHDTIKLKTPVKKDTLLVSRSNTDELVGAVCYVDRNVPSLFLSDLIWEVSARNKSAVSVRWLVYLLCSEQYRSQIVARANGTSGSMKKITKPGFLGIRIPLPPIIEQNKIAEILSAWDEAIEQTRKLIDVKKRHKKALMQQLLTGKSRFGNYDSAHWQIKTLQDLLEPVSRPVPKPQKPYLSIGVRSHGRGTFQKTIEQPEKVMMDTLYRVESHDLIVNITFAWEGAIAIASQQDSGGLVSHRFPTYRIREKEADIDFIRNLILTKRFVWDLGLISPGGAGRNRVLNQKDFLKLKVLVPSVEIQERIGKILTTADNEIRLSEDYLDALEKQKRGLMQKLLTSEVRVNK